MNKTKKRKYRKKEKIYKSRKTLKPVYVALCIEECHMHCLSVASIIFIYMHT